MVLRLLSLYRRGPSVPTSTYISTEAVSDGDGDGDDVPFYTN